MSAAVGSTADEPSSPPPQSSAYTVSAPVWPTVAASVVATRQQASQLARAAPQGPAMPVAGGGGGGEDDGYGLGLASGSSSVGSVWAGASLQLGMYGGAAYVARGATPAQTGARPPSSSLGEMAALGRGIAAQHYIKKTDFHADAIRGLELGASGAAAATGGAGVTGVPWPSLVSGVQQAEAVSAAGSVSLAVARLCRPGSALSIATGECIPCAAGSIAASPGQQSCDPCPPGTYAGGSGLAVCAPCDPGSFNRAARSPLPLHWPTISIFFNDTNTHWHSPS